MGGVGRAEETEFEQLNTFDNAVIVPINPICGIEPILDQGIDMIDVELPLMEHKVDRIIADEAATGLARQELLLQLRRLVAV